ncbi:MAG TPA: hypothetical protein VHS99_22385, partial [Chloroflexota bacterium]|nr:hypothetical protein [Chloroflexota bacterium]
MLRRTFAAAAGVTLAMAAPSLVVAKTEPGAATGTPSETQKGTAMTTTSPQSGYAPVNGLRMYYEIHGSGAPLVVLHGAYMTIELMGKLVPELVRKQVLASIGYRLDGLHPGLMEGLGEMKPEMMVGSPWHDEYIR